MYLFKNCIAFRYFLMTCFDLIYFLSVPYAIFCKLKKHAPSSKLTVGWHTQNRHSIKAEFSSVGTSISNLYYDKLI
jgi:hypothetical protein